MTKQEEQLVLAALQRMRPEKRRVAIAILLKMAPAEKSTPVLKLISGGRG